MIRKVQSIFLAIIVLSGLLLSGCFDDSSTGTDGTALSMNSHVNGLDAQSSLSKIVLSVSQTSSVAGDGTLVSSGNGNSSGISENSSNTLLTVTKSSAMSISAEVQSSDSDNNSWSNSVLVSSSVTQIMSSQSTASYSSNEQLISSSVHNDITPFDSSFTLLNMPIDTTQDRVYDMLTVDSEDIPVNAFRAFYFDTHYRSNDVCSEMVRHAYTLSGNISRSRIMECMHIYQVATYYIGSFTFQRSGTKIFDISILHESIVFLYINGVNIDITSRDKKIEYVFEKGVEYLIEICVEPYSPGGAAWFSMYDLLEYSENSSIQQIVESHPTAEIWVASVEYGGKNNISLINNEPETEAILFLLSENEVKWNLIDFNTSNIKAVIVSNEDTGSSIHNIAPVRPVVYYLPSSIPLLAGDHIPGSWIREEACDDAPDKTCITPDYFTMQDYLKNVYGAKITKFIGESRPDTLVVPTYK